MPQRARRSMPSRGEHPRTRVAAHPAGCIDPLCVDAHASARHRARCGNPIDPPPDCAESSVVEHGRWPRQRPMHRCITGAHTHGDPLGHHRLLRPRLEHQPAGRRLHPGRAPRCRIACRRCATGSASTARRPRCAARSRCRPGWKASRPTSRRCAWTWATWCRSRPERDAARTRGGGAGRRQALRPHAL
jgi:hypothetical protein